MRITPEEGAAHTPHARSCQRPRHSQTCLWKTVPVVHYYTYMDSVTRTASTAQSNAPMVIHALGGQGAATPARRGPGANNKASAGTSLELHNSQHCATASLFPLLLVDNEALQAPDRQSPEPPAVSQVNVHTHARTQASQPAHDSGGHLHLSQPELGGGFRGHTVRRDIWDALAHLARLLSRPSVANHAAVPGMRLATRGVWAFRNARARWPHSPPDPPPIPIPGIRDQREIGMGLFY